MTSLQKCLPPSLPRWPSHGTKPELQKTWCMMSQVLWICLDRLEEGDLGGGSLVSDPSQQVKHQHLWHADNKPIIKLYCETIGVAAWFPCGTKSGTSRQRTRKPRRSQSRSCQPWPGAESLNIQRILTVPLLPIFSTENESIVLPRRRFLFWYRKLGGTEKGARYKKLV